MSEKILNSNDLDAWKKAAAKHSPGGDVIPFGFWPLALDRTGANGALAAVRSIAVSKEKM